MIFDRFVGIPYLDRGRSIVGLACWGVVALMFREVRGIELPSYFESYVTAAERASIARLITGEFEPWLEIEAADAQIFDVVLMREGRYPACRHSYRTRTAITCAG